MFYYRFIGYNVKIIYWKNIFKAYVDITHLTVEMFNMEDQILTKGRNLTIINSQKKRIVPNVILHTKNVMIPVMKPLPTKQCYNVSSSENRAHILKAQNYRNNPALLFSETPSHTLYNHLEHLFEVKKIKRWKSKNQNTKYTVSGKTDSISIKKIDVLQNSCPSETLSFRKNNNMHILHFPNTTPVQSLVNNKELHKTSSKSIELSRKYNLSQMKESQIKDEDKFAVIPKIEMPISDIISKSQIVSLPSESVISFYDITDTCSTVSILSASSFNIENKKTFASIGNRKKSGSKIVSSHLHPSNSECEINVLHYENDISLEDEVPYFAPFYSKSLTNWSSTGVSGIAKNKDDNEHFDNKETTIEESHQNSNVNESIHNIKYSWQAINDWTSPFEKREYKNPHGIKNPKTYGAKPHECKIRYSWQVIGTSTQTSYSLLQSLLNDSNVENQKSAYKMCSVKYSWQIIGISTQVSLHNCNDPNYWSGILLTPNKNYNENNSQVVNNETDCIEAQNYTKYREKRLNRYLILNNQQTQTYAEKDIQADINDQHTKYSWHNLLKQYL